MNFNINPFVRLVLDQESWQHLSIPGKLMGYACGGEASPQMVSWLKENNWFLDYEEMSLGWWN